MLLYAYMYLIYAVVSIYVSMLLYAYMYLNICIHVCSLHPQVDLPKPTVPGVPIAEVHNMPALPEIGHGIICRHATSCHNVARHELGTSIGTITAIDSNIVSLHIQLCGVPVEEVDCIHKGLAANCPTDR